MTIFINKAPNPNFSGTVVGVVDAGGALPTGWTWSNWITGATLTVVSITTVAGRVVMRLRIQYNNTTGGDSNLQIYSAADLVSASAGQSYAFSARGSLPTPLGSPSAYSTGELIFYDGGGGYLADFDGGGWYSSTMHENFVVGVAPASTAYCGVSFGNLVPSGTNADFYLDVTQPQIVQGTFMPPYLGGDASGTYGADVTVSQITTTGAGAFTVPSGVAEVRVEVWSAGGSPAAATTCEDGGGSGGYARDVIAVTGGDILYYNVPAGQTQGAAQPSPAWVHKNTNSPTGADVRADSANGRNAGGGISGDWWADGAAGTLKQSGTSGSRAGSGGSSSAGPTGSGLAGTAGSSNTAGVGHSAGIDQGAGGNGGVSGANGAAGSRPGGGAGGGGNSGGNALAGGGGQIRFSYLTPLAVTTPFRRDLSYYLEQ